MDDTQRYCNRQAALSAEADFGACQVTGARPMFEVRMTMTLQKDTVRPWLSVTRPSSSTWSVHTQRVAQRK